MASALSYALVAILGGKITEKANVRLIVGVWLLHGLAVASSLISTDGVPHFGFAPILSATAWLVLSFYAFERHWFPQLTARLLLCALGALTVLLPLEFPGQPMHLSASPWLPLHLVFGLTAYGLFATAVVHGLLLTRTERLIRQAVSTTGTLPLLTLERLTFRFANAGFILLSATLLAGLLFGETLYGAGHFWKWDHKTVFSVLSWLTFAVLLFVRHRLGWRGKKALRLLYLGAGFLLLAYVGSRFVLEVILERAP